MPPDLLIHPITARLLASYQKQPPHALLLTGPIGIGKLTIAKHWAQSFTQPQIVEPDEKGTLSIDKIRSLYRATRSRHSQRQVIIIDHAQAMGTEAQNALLKLLEEPTPNTTFILCAPHTNSLLPTILSRLQHLAVRPIADQTLKKHIPPTINAGQALFIARGRPATLMQLIQQPDQLEQASQHMRLAKSLLGASQYQRFAAVSQLATSKETCLTVLDAMLHMVGLQLKNPTTPTIEQWLQREAALETCLSKIHQNGNLRAQLLRLFSHF